MIKFLPKIPLFSLQTYFKADNPIETMILVISIGAIVIIAIVVHFTRHRTSKSIIGNDKAAVIPRRFSGFTLRRIASAHGLNREQTKLLEFIFRNDAVTDPEGIMKNPALLDLHFKRAYKAIIKNSGSEGEKQAHIAKLFSLRNTIELSEGVGKESSDKLSENTPAILALGKDNFTVKILIARGQSIVIDHPRNLLGSPIRIAKGTKVKLSFFTKSSSGFSYDGSVVDSVNTDFGPGLQITHSTKSTPLVKRKFRRRQIDAKCDFYLVYLEESGRGRKKTSKLVADTKRFTGNIQDLSVGGCAIKTSSSIQAGSRLKITVNYSLDHQINVLGQVIRSNRSNAANILHVKFLKVPGRSFNSISTLVFGYNEE